MHHKIYPRLFISSIIKDIVKSLQHKVGDKKVILALSGGVDSTVVAALLNKALPKQLTCVFIDTGLLRKQEVAEVQYQPLAAWP